MLTKKHQRDIKKLATATAAAFVHEWQTALGPESGDWDAAAWDDDRRKLSFSLAGERYAEAWEYYHHVLIEETQRLADNR